MSQLVKAISRLQRSESGARIGFGAQVRAKPRAMLLGLMVKSGTEAKAAFEGGVDVVILRAETASKAAPEIKAVANGACVGVLLAAFDDGGAEALKSAGCDFVIAPLESSASTAIEPEKMGHVVAANSSMTDTTLRALAPLGLDGLYVEHTGGAMTLAGQLELVRLSSFASSPLLVTIGNEPTVAELRVLRDSGTAVVVAPQGTAASKLSKLIEALKSVPPPRKVRREGGEMALVPSVTIIAEEEEGDEEENE